MPPPWSAPGGGCSRINDTTTCRVVLRSAQRGRCRVGATFLELFFDLAFVLVLSQVATVLLADLSLTGALRTALLLAAVWWAWVTTTWATDWYAPRAPTVRVVLVAAALATLLMGVAVPAALADRTLLFAGAYVATGVTTAILLVVAALDRAEVFAPR